MLAAASRRAWRSFSSISSGGIIDRFFAGKPGYTHDNGEKAKAEYNHHDAHDAFISYLEGVDGVGQAQQEALALSLPHSTQAAYLRKR